MPPIYLLGLRNKAGLAMFASIEQVFLMETMMRFKDLVLKRILEKMRAVGGTPLTEEEWAAGQATAVDARTLDAEPARCAFLQRSQGTFTRATSGRS